MEEDFEFDRFTSRASFDEVRNLMVEQRRLPSMESPDRKWLYLSSVDIQVRLDNQKEMKLSLEGVKERLEQLKQDPNPNYSKLNDCLNDISYLEARLPYAD